MEVINRPTTDLIPYAFNNKTHSDTQVDRIANSINEFGFNQPIVVDENNVIIVGHGRLAAAKKLGLENVPVLCRGDLSETQKRAYRILDNKLANDADWETSALELELDFLDEQGLDLEFWGLDQLKDLFPEEEPTVEEDEPGEVEDDVEPWIKVGDLIELGRHRVFCGDSTSKDIFTELVEENISLVLTDPPYGVNHVGGTKDPTRKTHRSGGVVHNDDLGKEGTRELIIEVLSLAFSQSSAGAALYVCSPAGDVLPAFLDAFTCSGFEYKHSLVWVKNAFVFGRADYHYKHELILYGWKAGAAHYFCDDRTQSTVFEFDRGDKNIAHPTSKPVGLFGTLIKNSSRTGEIVYDPFLGSGTTLIAAEQAGRQCYGIELSPKYCQVIIDRYRKLCQKNGKDFVCKVNGEQITSENCDL